MKPLYIIEPGLVGRTQNTIHFENELVKRKYPIKEFDSIFFLNEISINSKAINMFAYDEIPLHFFNYNGRYTGSFWPGKVKDGKFIIKQVESLKDRIHFAKEIVKSSIHNMKKVLLKYNIREYPERLNELIVEVEGDINRIRSVEANAKKIYYRCFNYIIKNKDFKFIKRTYNPPEDEINALISFGNALLYSTVLTELYKTKLDPAISYVHESSNRFSLNLDIADIFKPIIVDRVIFTLINKKMIFKSDFEKNLLKKEARKKFIKTYEDKLNETIRFNDYEVFSYRYIIRKEFYKIINHIEKGIKYEGFKMWW
jgi:CRISPR-associated protein Cas1